MDLKSIRKSFIKQHDQSDCGIACLMSIINFFGGKERPERLREISGATKQGTTLLGLYLAAEQAGLIPEGLETNAEYLKNLENPVILHVITESKHQHFIVCYGYYQNKFIIGNPAKGIEEYTSEKINTIWLSKALLKVIPGRNFIKRKQTRSKKIKWLKELIKDDINILSASLLLGIVISILGIVMAVFSQKLVDDILPDHKTKKLIAGLIIVSFLLFMRTGLSYVHRFFGIKQCRDFNLRIIDFFYSNLLRLPITFFNNRKTGDMVARLNDTAIIQQTIAYIINSLIINFLVLIVSGIVVSIYSVTAGIISFLSLPVFLLIAYFFHDKIVTGQRKVMEAYSRNESNYINSIQGIEIIKSTNNEKYFSDINKLVYGFYQATIFKLGKINCNLGFAAEATVLLFSVTLLAVNSFMVINKSISAGTLIAISGISSSMLSAIAALAFANLQIQGARIAFGRMFEFAGLNKEYDLKSENSKTSFKVISELAMQDISFRFPGRKQLFRDISFTVRQGEMVTLFGESGCGKTTIINIIQKYYAPDKGKYLINYIDSNEFSVINLRKHISIVPQITDFFNGTLIDNICLEKTPRTARDFKVFCRHYGFDMYFEQLPQGYATMLGEDGVNISGGQQQLVSLARAIYRNPQVLLLDEPTSSMDRETENFVLNVLAELRNKSMIINVTHKIRTAKVSDRIYLIGEKGIEQAGSHKELISADNIYSRAYNELVL